MITHTKQYGIYHWDTFDNETLLTAEADTLEEARATIHEIYKDRIRLDGADRVDIVDLEGNVITSFNVG